MTSTIFLASMLVISHWSISAQANVVYQDIGSDWAERYVYLPPEDFSTTVINKLVLEHLRPFRSYRLVKIVIASDRQDILNMRRGKAMADYSYDLWATVLAERLEKKQPLAVALKVDGNVAFRYRDASGASTERVLSGENPFILESPHGAANVLHVSFSRVPHGRKGLVFVSFFLEIRGQLSEPTAREFALLLKRAIGTREQVLAIFRRDVWFIENEGFPVFYPFRNAEEPPTAAEYACTQTIVCGSREGEVTCRTQDYAFGKCR